MKKNRPSKATAHRFYRFKKSFYRKFGRKPFVTLNKKMRKERKQKKRSIKKRRDHDRIVVKLPEIISLEVSSRSMFLQEINKIHKIAYTTNSAKSLSIDHSQIRHIDPEALLILASEIKRLSNVLPVGKFKYSKKYAPRDEHIKDLLGSIGYWNHFNITTAKHTDLTKEYFQIHHDTKSVFQAVADMRDFFEDKLSFLPSGDLTETFDNALTEAIANAVEHAYKGSISGSNTIPGAWWIAGHFDPGSNELVFGCYDHGIGIRESLLMHEGDRIARWSHLTKVRVKKDAEVIKLLLSQKLKTNNKRDRGYGTQQFIKLIDNYGHGSLDVYSKSGHYRISKDGLQKKDIIRNHNEAMDGTLIVWKMKVEREG